MRLDFFFCRPVTSDSGLYSTLKGVGLRGGALSEKVGKGMCGPERVPFQPVRFINDPFFI